MTPAMRRGWQRLSYVVEAVFFWVFWTLPFWALLVLLSGCETHP